MTWWEDFVEADRRAVELAGQKIGQGVSALPAPVKSAGQTALTALNAPLTGLGGLVALGQGRDLQEAAAGIEQGKTVGNYLTEAIPEPQYQNVQMNVLQELARQGAGLATDVGAGVIGPLEMGMAGYKGAKAVLPDVLDSMSSGGGRTMGRGLGRASESGRVYIPGPKDIPTPTREENLAKFMEGSKAVTPEGKPKTLYSGHSNVSMYGTEFDPKKATAGAFYATEDPAIASNYAIGKMGSKEFYGSGKEYRLKGKGGKFNKKLWQIDLSPEQMQKVEKWMMDEDKGISIDMKKWAKENAPYDKTAARLNARPNNLQNIHDFMDEMGYTIHNSVDDPNAFPRYQSSHFEDMLEEAGLPWDSYLAERPGVLPLHASIKNPLDTSSPFPPALLEDLKKAAKGTRHVTEKESLDLKWTRDYPLRNWVQDIEKGDTYWATHVPKKAVPIFKKHGYDGIKDVGGKGGGPQHPVWISFDPGQVKSATGNVGTFDPTNPNMLKGVAAGAPAAGAVAMSDEDERKVLMDIIRGR